MTFERFRPGTLASLFVVQSAAAPNTHPPFRISLPVSIMIIVLDERHKADLAFFQEQDAESSSPQF